MVRKLIYLLLLPLCTTGCTTCDEGTDFPEKRLLGLTEYRQVKTKLEHLIGQPIVKGFAQTKGRMHKQEPPNHKN